MDKLIRNWLIGVICFIATVLIVGNILSNILTTPNYQPDGPAVFGGLMIVGVVFLFPIGFILGLYKIYQCFRKDKK